MRRHRFRKKSAGSPGGRLSVLRVLVGSSLLVFPAVAVSQETPKTAQPESPPAEKAIPGNLPLPVEFDNRFAQNYTLTFASKLDGGRFQITRERTTNYPSTLLILKIGDTSEDGKFRLDKFEEREGMSALGVRVDVSRVTITFLETGKEFVLTRRVPEVIPTFFAKLSLPAAAGARSMWEDYIKQGSEFTLPGLPDRKFRLAEVDLEKAVIEFRDGDGKLRAATIEKAKP